MAKNKTKVRGSAEFSSLHTATKELCLTYTWLILLWDAEVWIEALNECWAKPFAAKSVNVCLPSRRLLEQLNHGRQNQSKGSNVLIFHVIYLCLCKKWDDFPHLASFMFLLFLCPLYSVWDVSSGGERWGTPSTFVWHLIKTHFYVVFFFVFVVQLLWSKRDVRHEWTPSIPLLWKNILHTTVYELGIVEQPRDAARECGQDVGTVCGSFPAPVSLILNVNQRDWQTLSPWPPGPCSEHSWQRLVYLRVSVANSYLCLIFLMFVHTFFFKNRWNWSVPQYSAAINRVPVLGLEGEPGVWRAQPHSAGEQEAGQGPGESVTQWVAAAHPYNKC